VDKKIIVLNEEPNAVAHIDLRKFSYTSLSKIRLEPHIPLI